MTQEREEAHWLDKIIEEQAKHYGMPVQKFKRFMSDAAEGQALVEKENGKEPTYTAKTKVH